MSQVEANRRRLRIAAASSPPLRRARLARAPRAAAAQRRRRGRRRCRCSAPPIPTMTLMGAAPGGEPGEAWGYRQLPLVGRRGPKSARGRSPSARRRTRPSPTPSSPSSATPTPAAGRSSTPRSTQPATPTAARCPNRLSARITRDGGGVLVGRDPSRPVGEQVVVLHHDPGGPWRALPPPPPDGAAAGRRRNAGRGAGRRQAAPAQVADRRLRRGRRAPASSSRPGAARSPTRSSTTTVQPNGRREPVELPAGSEEHFQHPGDRRDRARQRLGDRRSRPTRPEPLASSCCERTTTPEGPLWVERASGRHARFADRDTPALEIAGAGTDRRRGAAADGDRRRRLDRPRRRRSQALQRDVTLFYDSGSDAVTGSWCDAAAVCGDGRSGSSSRARSATAASPGRAPASARGSSPTRSTPAAARTSNRGTYLRFADGAASRGMPGGGGNFRASGAFSSADSGWLDGPVEISAKTRARAAALLAGLAAGAADRRRPRRPGAAPGSLGSAALAVGADGGVARYEPGRAGSASSCSPPAARQQADPARRRLAGTGPRLRGRRPRGDVAVERRDGLWIADPGVPIGFEGNLMDVAFDPAEPESRLRGRQGRACCSRYGKSWEQEALPAGFEGANLTSIAFAGSQAIVAAGGDLLVNDGGGWHVDASAHALLDSGPRRQPAALRRRRPARRRRRRRRARHRDRARRRPGAPWRFSEPAAARLDRDRRRGGARRRRGAGDRLGGPAARLPAGRRPARRPTPTCRRRSLPPFSLPGDGYLLRETAAGWVDEQRTAFAGSGADRPLKSDPVLALLLDAAGNGWAVGGWSGYADAAGRGTSASGGGGGADPGPGAHRRDLPLRRRRRGAPPAAATAAGPDAGRPGPPRRRRPRRVRGSLRRPRPARRSAPTAPSRAALRTGRRRCAGGDGPRALLYTGNRVATAASATPTATATRRCSARHPGLPVFPALGSGDAGGGFGVGGLRSRLRRLPGAVRRRRRAGRHLHRRHPRRAAGSRRRAPTTPSTAAAPAGRCGSS